jgi:DNA-binding NarL/FixJ family response regulator
MIEQPGVTIILILDFRLPDMDGALLAAKLRELLPEAPIIALSSLSESGPLMGFSGVTRTLSKRLPDDALREQLHAVLAEPTAAPPDPVLAPYLASHATTMALLQPQGISVALLASSRPMLQLLHDALQQAAVAVHAQTTHAPVLEQILTTIPVQALVSDGPAWSRARTLAAARGVPLLVIALSLSTAISLSMEPIGVLVTPEPGELLHTLEQLRAGVLVRDRRIAAAYDVLELTAAERSILPFLLRDIPIEQIARELHLSESAVRKTRARALARLRAERVDEVRIALDELLIA